LQPLCLTPVTRMRLLAPVLALGGGGVLALQPAAFLPVGTRGSLCPRCCSPYTMSASSGAMPYRKLGSSDLSVSQVGLGTMTFGLQTGEEESLRLLSVAAEEYGVNFFDTSELYPYPSEPATAGASDRILGKWLKGRDRSQVVIASKVCGPSNFITWLRSGGKPTALTGEQMLESVDESLRRLGTDYIDLLQVAWPGRYTGDIGEDCYDESKAEEDPFDCESQLMGLQELIDSGKVRHIGLCEETTFGLLQACEHADWDDLPKVVSVQNTYNLLERSKVELSLIEASSRENVGIIARSPLAGGALTGKYLGQTDVSLDRNARLNAFPGFQGRYLNEISIEAVAQYQGLASRFDLSPAQLAMAFVHSRPHIASTLTGATSEVQLRENLDTVAMNIFDK
ncbi:unnamed protein product, partial [Chrysoparadoxa australica]